MLGGVLAHERRGVGVAVARRQRRVVRSLVQPDLGDPLLAAVGRRGLAGVQRSLVGRAVGVGRREEEQGPPLARRDAEALGALDDAARDAASDDESLRSKW